MADLAQIREGLAVNLSALEGVKVSAYMVDDPWTPGIYIVGPDTVEYDLSIQRGVDLWIILAQAFTAPTTAQGKQLLLDQWLAPTGAQSFKAALESDPTLGGIVAGARVSRVDAYRDYTMPIGGRVLFGASFYIEVYNPGS